MCSNMFAGFLSPVKPQEVSKFKRKLKTYTTSLSFYLSLFHWLEEDTNIDNVWWGCALAENGRTVESAMFYSVV